MGAAYLDCCSGVSGNMLLGALLDAGLPEQTLRQILTGLDLDGYALDIETTVVQSLHCHRVEVHCHEHHVHRGLSDIRTLLEAAALPEPVRRRAVEVFTRLATAEAAVHGTGIEEIHFHEVGAIDAIIDIVGTVFGFHHLGVDHLICSPLPMTRGFIDCAHGAIPLPGPAVCRLLEGVPVYGESLDQELVTPTGAALVRTLADRFGPMPSMLLGRTGTGAGTLMRKDGRPNILRLMLGTLHEVAEYQQVEVIETHLDDMNPEIWPYVGERLLQLGVLDISLTPMQMKKGRPGFLVRVVCDPSLGGLARDLLLRETSAIGLRYRREQRQTLAREAITVTTDLGPIRAKQVHVGQQTRITPEYEACRQAAQHHGLPLQEVYTTVLNQQRRD